MTGEPPGGVPPAEVPIDESIVKHLLLEQHPDLASLPIRLAATGWDNATYRLGETLAVRLPRIQAAVPLIMQEQRWLPEIAAGLQGSSPISVPVPERVGLPGKHFPWPWSVVPWIPGQPADHDALPAAAAGGLGRFLATLHGTTPDGFPRNTWRGAPLPTHRESIAALLDRPPLPAGAAEQAAPAVDFAVVRRLWDEAVATPIDTAPVRIHGDLHPRNIVVRDNRLAAVIDWGDMTIGDVATDLAAAWMLFPEAAHADVWQGYGGPTADTLTRTKGWAVFFGLTTLRAGIGTTGQPVFARIGLATLSRLCAADPSGR